MNPGIWWGDEIGVSITDETSLLLGPTRLMDINLHVCSKHGTHLRLLWNNGDGALATIQPDGFWLSEPVDEERMAPQRADQRQHIAQLVEQELESQLAL